MRNSSAQDGRRRVPERFAFAPSLRLGSGRDELEQAMLELYRSCAIDTLGELWEEDVERLCGARWKPRPSAQNMRAGWCSGPLTLAGKRAAVRRPRVRSTQGREIELPSIKLATGRDLLDREAVEDVTAAVATGSFPVHRHRRDPGRLEFVQRLARRIRASQAVPRRVFARGLLIASIDFPDQTFLGAVGLEPDGNRELVALGAGSALHEPTVERLLQDVLAKHRGAPAEPDVFFLGEEPAVHAAVRRQFGASAVIHRSPHEKRRRVLGLLPPPRQADVLESLLAAWERKDPREAELALREVTEALDGEHPQAAAALSEGLPETLTLHRLLGGERGALGAAIRHAPSRA